MRRNSGTCIVILLVALAILTVTSFAGDDAASLLKELEKTYDAIRDATVKFTQQVSYGVTNAEQTFRGELRMKKGNKYRIELEDQTIVTDGISVWSYTKSNDQVIIDKYKEDPHSFSPDKILVNAPQKYSATILGKEKEKGEEITLLKLVPTDPKSNVQWMKVWVDEDHMMKKIQVLDISDNTTTYTIDSMSLNAGIADTEFRYTVPDGAEVIDLR